MKELWIRQKLYWSNQSFAVSSFTGILFFISCMILHYAAGTYATQRAGSAVEDLILSRLPVLDVNIIFIEGNILFWTVIITLLLNQPKRIPFILKTMALFMLIRAFFVILTHLGPDPTELIIRQNSIIDKFTFGGDLFFSGHTGAPFLMALAFWNNKYLRISFLISSVIFGISVLLGHLHYSIDVFAAFFISYGIFHIARFLFAADCSLMHHGLEQKRV